MYITRGAIVDPNNEYEATLARVVRQRKAAKKREQAQRERKAKEWKAKMKRADAAYRREHKELVERALQKMHTIGYPEKRVLEKNNKYYLFVGSARAEHDNGCFRCYIMTDGQVVTARGDIGSDLYLELIDYYNRNDRHIMRHRVVTKALQGFLES